MRVARPWGTQRRAWPAATPRPSLRQGSATLARLLPGPRALPRFALRLDRQTDQQPFEDQPRRHGAVALEVLIGFQQPAVELRAAAGGPAGEAAARPFSATNGLTPACCERVGKRYAAAGRLGLQNQPRGRGETAQRGRNLRQQPDRLLVGSQQAIELPDGLARLCRRARHRASPKWFWRASRRPIGSTISGVIFLPFAGHQRQLGQLLVEQPQFRPDHFHEQLRRPRGRAGAMLLLGPVHEPLRQPWRRRRAAIDRQTRGGHRLVEPRVARHRFELQHQHAAPARGAAT